MVELGEQFFVFSSFVRYVFFRIPNKIFDNVDDGGDDEQHKKHISKLANKIIFNRNRNAIEIAILIAMI